MNAAPLTPEQLFNVLAEVFPEKLSFHSGENLPQPWIEIPAEELLPVAKTLRTDERLYFDFLESIAGLDLRPRKAGFQVVYHFCSVLHGHRITLKVNVPTPTNQTAERTQETTDSTPENPAKEEENSPDLDLPAVPSLAGLWPAADWHERETYDLLGIPFSDHPDPRRILLPADWQGHPLRKDYATEEYYHGIRIDYY